MENGQTSARPLPTWLSIWWRIVGSGSAIVLTASLFVWLHDDGPEGGRVAVLSIIGQIGAALLLIIPVVIATRPLARLRAQLAAGVLPEALPRADVLSALQLPRAVFAMVIGFHTLFALSATLAVASGIAALPIVSLARILPATVAFALITGTSQMQLVGRLTSQRVTPLLLPRGRLDHLADATGRVPRTYVFEHMTLLLLCLIVGWPMLFYSLLYDTPSGPMVSYFVLGALVLFITGFQVNAILRIVSLGVGHIAGRMEEVRKGNLAAHARIFELDTFGVLASDFNRMVEGLRQRELLKETFGRYVTQQVADEILAGRVALGGELRTATVLFSDIRGFTRMSEQMTPQEVVAFLNEYLSAMVDCVLEHGGVLDKFIGDAVMAVFGAPVSAGDRAADAMNAVACAVAMGKRLHEMNARRAASGLAPIEIGIGVHTGELVAGNIGSPKRMEYTVIGDTVNVGARLESMTKEHKRRTLLSSVTAGLVRERFALVDVGTVPVRGRAEPLQVFGLADDLPVHVSADVHPADAPVGGLAAQRADRA